MTEMMQTNHKRLLALDVLRGITIAGMILVSNPGTWDYIYAPLGHSAWHGMTPTDLIFPFFMFIMGISTYISLKKKNFQWSSSATLKIVRRVIVIFGISIAIVWFSVFCWKFNSLSSEPFFERFTHSALALNHLPLSGVLPRLALSYGATALIAISIRHKYIPYIIASILISYFLALVFGNGFALEKSSILSRADYFVFGTDYMENRIIDSEGILSTFPAIAQVLIGFYCGKLLLETTNLNEKILRLFLIGTSLMFLGFLLSYSCPINKLIWSPTFVLVTCGLASNFLAILIWIIDIKGKKNWSSFFNIFGVNPLFMYTLGAFIAALLGNIEFPYHNEMISIHSFVYEIILRPICGNYFGSLVYALLFILLNWSIGYILYKKEIYIKI